MGRGRGMLVLLAALAGMVGLAGAASAQSQFSNTTIFKPGALSDPMCHETFLWAAQARPEEAQVWLGNVPAAIAAYRRACDEYSLAEGCDKASGLLRSDRNPKPDLALANAYQIKAQRLRGVKLP